MSDHNTTGKLLKKRTNLSLNKETLRTLGADLLDDVNGGKAATAFSVVGPSSVAPAPLQIWPPPPKKPAGPVKKFSKWVASGLSASLSAGVSQSVGGNTAQGKCRELTRGTDWC